MYLEDFLGPIRLFFKPHFSALNIAPEIHLCAFDGAGFSDREAALGLTITRLTIGASPFATQTPCPRWKVDAVASLVNGHPPLFAEPLPTCDNERPMAHQRR
jgi:hypothetical protein